MIYRLRHYRRQKKSTYRSSKAENDIRPQYKELGRTVKRLTRKVESNYETKVGSQAKTKPKGLFRFIRRL